MSVVPTSVFHYTRTATLWRVIASREFWLSNVFLMNDYTEVNWLYAIARSVVREESANAITHYSHETYPSSPGTGSSSSHSSISVPHSRYYTAIEDYLSKVDFAHVYCGCFSKSEDDLSQWRGYADDGKGVALELDCDAIQEHNKTAAFEWREMCYDTVRQEEKVRDVITGYADRIHARAGDVSGDPITLAQMAHHAISLMAAGCKNPKFVSEQEVRLIVRAADTGVLHDPTQYDRRMFRCFPSPIDFHERDGIVVPYTKIKLPHRAIKSVWLGPRFGNIESEAALKFFLSRNRIKAVVRTSEASYR